jgi:hypothetical protein
MAILIYNHLNSYAISSYRVASVAFSDARVITACYALNFQALHPKI